VATRFGGVPWGVQIREGEIGDAHAPPRERDARTSAAGGTAKRTREPEGKGKKQAGAAKQEHACTKGGLELRQGQNPSGDGHGV
jgi:hypothetical protein